MDTKGILDETEEISGVVGFQANADFFKAVKQVLGLEHLKLLVKIYENII